MPDGWVGIAEDLVRELDSVLTPHPDASLAIYAESKLGTLRLHHLLVARGLPDGVRQSVRDAAEPSPADAAG